MGVIAAFLHDLKEDVATPPTLVALKYKIALL